MPPIVSSEPRSSVSVCYTIHTILPAYATKSWPDMEDTAACSVVAGLGSSCSIRPGFGHDPLVSPLTLTPHHQGSYGLMLIREFPSCDLDPSPEAHGSLNSGSTTSNLLSQSLISPHILLLCCEALPSFLSPNRSLSLSLSLPLSFTRIDCPLPCRFHPPRRPGSEQIAREYTLFGGMEASMCQ